MEVQTKGVKNVHISRGLWVITLISQYFTYHNQSKRSRRLKGVKMELDDTLTKILKKTLQLNLYLKPIEKIEGPVVTTYKFKCDSIFSKVQARSEDYALAVGASSVLISRLGEYVTLEIPNQERKFVDFKDYLYWFMTSKDVQEAKLAIPLGLNTRGEKEFFDLAKAPHVLISGQTGSGKSVYESAILTSLAAKYDSSQLELYLVDTKKVDLPLFATLPQVRIVAKDLMEYFRLHNHIKTECSSRLDIFHRLKVRNIVEHNEKLGDSQAKMPYIVLLIDELANLMDLDTAFRKGLDPEVRRASTPLGEMLKNLAQISRAAGIHIIASTQRSSVKVISGDIKVNFPVRIGLKMPSQIDSRVILDEMGAENLLGRGDMLVKTPETDFLQRFHGPFVRLDDIREIVENLEMVKQAFKPF